MTEDTPKSNQVICPRCKRLITYPSISAGANAQCPHCNLDFVVSGEMLEREAEKVAEQPEIYDLKVAPSAEVPTPSLPAFKTVSKFKAESEEERLSWCPRQAPPPELFRNKTFSAPFSVGFRACAVMLLVSSLILGYMTSRMLYYFGESVATSGQYMGSSLHGFNPFFFGFIFTLCTVLIGVPYLIMLTVLGMSIFRDTCEGDDKFASWPWDWNINIVQDASYVLIALFWAGLPIFIASSLLPGAAWIKVSILILAELVFFPVFFLSALDSKSAVMLYSLPVWKNISYSWRTWRLFYLQTIPLGIGLIVVLKINFAQAVWLKIILVYIFMSYFCMVYFRLLGRLARYCSGSLDEIEQPEDIPEADSSAEDADAGLSE